MFHSCEQRRMNQTVGQDYTIPRGKISKKQTAKLKTDKVKKIKTVKGEK